MTEETKGIDVEETPTESVEETAETAPAPKKKKNKLTHLSLKVHNKLLWFQRYIYLVLCYTHKSHANSLKSFFFFP